MTIDNRRAAENVAYHVLNRLENDCTNVLGAPWEDSMVLSDEYVACIMLRCTIRVTNELGKTWTSDLVNEICVRLKS